MRYYKKKGHIDPPLKRRTINKQDGGQIEEVRVLIPNKVEEHKRVLSEVRENVLMLN